MLDTQRDLSDPKYCPNRESTWTNYGCYRLLLWAWMLNEASIVFSPTAICHNGFYIQGILHIICAILVGIPLVYSEICISQYTNHGPISTWNFFPLLRPVGYGTIFLVLLKTVYMMTLTSWYLKYTFYAAFDPPPWYTCEDYNITKCMVKKLNVSIFQHCLEAQNVFGIDCGIRTASNWFFGKEIGDNNTLNNSLYCALTWKTTIASGSIGAVLFVLSLRKVKFIEICVKLLAVYICVVTVLLLCVALSTSGAWKSTNATISWDKYTFISCFDFIVKGFLSVGTGYGVIGFLSRDVPFRSPATMTSISTSLLSVLVTVMYALICFSGIKTMSYYHGEEMYVIEMSTANFFLEFASLSEIMSYFYETPVWRFLWFSSIFFCLFLNLWILYFYLLHLVLQNINCARLHASVCNVVVAALMCFMSWPLFCSDITGAFTDSIEIIQITSSFLFSFSLYWVYGFMNHNNDIIFMIGIKASYFWKMAWMLNPVLILTILYAKCNILYTQEHEDSMYLDSVSTHLDLFIVYIIVTVYGVIVFTGVLVEIIRYSRHGVIREIFFPTEDWGPKDKILLKSRKMFVPEIMTREFLYRQVRIRGLTMKDKTSCNEKKAENDLNDSCSRRTEWSAFTSN